MSSAIATFLAARKQPRSSIERLMSTSSTVAARSVLGPVDLEVVAGAVSRLPGDRSRACTERSPSCRGGRGGTVAELVGSAVVARARRRRPSPIGRGRRRRRACSRANSSSRTLWPIRRAPRGVSSSRSPLRSSVARLFEARSAPGARRSSRPRHRRGARATLVGSMLVERRRRSDVADLLARARRVACSSLELLQRPFQVSCSSPWKS